MEGEVIGFDEFMNLVLDNAEEVHLTNPKNRKKDEVRKEESRVKLGSQEAIKLKRILKTSFTGRILLKGDNITLLMKAPTRSGDGDEEMVS